MILLLWLIMTCLMKILKEPNLKHIQCHMNNGSLLTQPQMVKTQTELYLKIFKEKQGIASPTRNLQQIFLKLLLKL